jgi:hypothetical protein
METEQDALFLGIDPFMNTEYAKVENDTADGQFSLESGSNGMAMVDTGAVPESTDQNPLELINTPETTSLPTLNQVTQGATAALGVANTLTNNPVTGVPKKTGVYGSGTSVVATPLSKNTAILLLAGIGILIFIMR